MQPVSTHPVGSTPGAQTVRRTARDQVNESAQPLATTELRVHHSRAAANADINIQTRNPLMQCTSVTAGHFGTRALVP